MIKPLAFLRQDGRHTVVVINSDSHLISIQIENLTSGGYEVILTDPNNRGKKLPKNFIAVGEPLIFEMPPKAIVTFHGI